MSVGEGVPRGPHLVILYALAVTSLTAFGLLGYRTIALEQRISSLEASLQFEKAASLRLKRDVVGDAPDCACPPVPAPNMYKLKTLVGYDDHDISKWREPAFTMGNRNYVKKDDNLPGPKYDLGDVTRFGTKNPLMFSLGRRDSLTVKRDMPGPSAYAPEKFEDLRFKKAPAASLKDRLKDLKKMDYPSPAEYEAPGGIGKSHPTVHASPAAVLMPRRTIAPRFDVPAPNTYGNPNIEVTKKTAPMASLGQRMPDKAPPKGPGPGEYNPQMNNARSPPAFSFGTKRSRCIEPYKEKDSTPTLC